MAARQTKYVSMRISAATALTAPKTRRQSADASDSTRLFPLPDRQHSTRLNQPATSTHLNLQYHLSQTVETGTGNEYLWSGGIFRSL